MTALLLVPMLAAGGDTLQSDLDWLVGCWVSSDKSSQEVWVADGEGSIIGFGVALRANEVGFYELLSLKRNAGDGWTYTAHPSGQAPASFVATEIGEYSVVFTNPDHDYPQEIRYWRDGDELFATTSLLGGANSNAFNKTACN